MLVELMQFSAVLLMVSLTIKLLILPKRAVNSFKVCRSRWLLTAGSALLAIQFLLQYTLGLRNHNVSAAVMLNVAFFVPCSALFSLSVINLQRQGFLSRQEKYIFIPVWILAIILMLFGIRTGQSSGIFWTEIAASALYAAMQSYYSFHQIRYMKMIRHALANYYDRDMDDLLQWMRWSIYIMTLMAILVPMMIFVQGKLLAVFGILVLAGIFYLVDCFCLYTVSNAPAKVLEAQQNEEEVLNEQVSDLQQKSEEHVSDSALHRVDIAVANWIDKRGHLKAGLNLPAAAEEIGVPRYLLSAWLKQKSVRYNDWLAELRIDEAKQVMQAHPDWSNETVAQRCGFSDRTYFQRKFKQLTGTTPNDYLTNADPTV